MYLEFEVVGGLCLILVGLIFLIIALWQFLKNKKFKKNCVRGKAIMEGYWHGNDSQSSVYTVRLVGVEGLHGFNYNSKMKKADYPAGTEIDVDYLKMGKFFEIDMVDYPPVGKYVTPYFLGLMGAILCIVGIVIFL